jgi:glycosyltransferase involved in cell wall biosynthesis
MKLILSHPTGNANVRAALKGFYDSSMLDSFHTSIASFKNSFYDIVGKLKPFKELDRRKFNDALAELTYSYPSKELGRIFATKFNFTSLIKHETGLFSIDSVYRYIDTKVSTVIAKKKNIDSIYCYEDGAIQSFRVAKNRGVDCLYDLPIGYWRSARNLLEEERKARPEWANTIVGFKDSYKKLQKKDDELLAADHIFVASSFTEQTLLNFPGKLSKISVIPYGFPDISTGKEYDYDGKRRLKLLFVGGLSQRKGIANVLEAVEKFGDSVNLTVVGHKATHDCKPLNEGLKKHTWLPSLHNSEVLKLMRESDVLIFPSLFEGFGLVITEAMSQGTPVITTDRTAGKDLIEDNRNGWIVEASSTASIISVINNILNKPDIVTEVGIEALNTAKLRSWDAYSKDLALAVQNLEKK